ncbi:MAG: Asp-tRNA(Asn)/Glu-tRNA(Gln) amidotransferase subunit GatB [Myxococcota bacterium]
MTDLATGGSESRYEVVVGLETHVHLRTESKLFSPAPVLYGKAPNHCVHPVCLALPGVLPVVNRHAVELAIRVSLAAHCTVHERSIFARKNYFYPDLPKGYQISQFEEPLATEGWIEIRVGGNGEDDGKGEGSKSKRIRLTRIHMEEDAGKSIHDDGVAGSDATLIDLNRCGVALVEIVSEPDLRSAEEVNAYLRTLRLLLRYTEVSHADMELGHLRCDVNISLRHRGEEEYGTRTELKNLNSFRFIEEAIEAEVKRQTAILESGGEVLQATLRYDPERRETFVMRLKEDSDDYRYFPDPDLIPLVVSTQEIERIRSEIPELAEQKRERFGHEHGLSEYAANQLIQTRALADFFEAAAVAHGQPKPVANWVLRDVMQVTKEREIEIDEIALTPESLASLIRLVDDGKTTVKSARALLPELIENGGDPAALVRERGLEAVSDSGVIDQAVAEVLAENPENVEKYHGGDEKVINFLMGQVMRKTQGKANPASVREVLTRELSK